MQLACTAATGNHVALLEWLSPPLYVHVGTHSDDDTLIDCILMTATEEGALDVAKWARARGGRWRHELGVTDGPTEVMLAASRGNLPMLEYCLAHSDWSFDDDWRHPWKAMGAGRWYDRYTAGDTLGCLRFLQGSGHIPPKVHVDIWKGITARADDDPFKPALLAWGQANLVIVQHTGSSEDSEGDSEADD